MSKIQEIKGKIAALNMQLGRERNALRETIIAKVNEVAESSPYKRVSKNICVVRFSDLIGNPWTPHFYNWQASVPIVINYLEKAEPRVEMWATELTRLVNASKDNQVYIPEVRNGHYVTVGFYSKQKVKLSVNKKFVEKIIEAINNI